MLKIGDFSRMAQVTVKTLRHYGKVGLLKPVWIDRFSGYRYYSVQQLPRLYRILALKDLGFSLQEIREMLDDALPATRLRSVLTSKQVELEENLKEERLRLAQVESRLKQIEREGNLNGYEVVLKRTEAHTVAVVREVLPELGEAAHICSLVKLEIADWLKNQQIRIQGPWFTQYLDPGFSDRIVHVEIGVMVEPVSPRRTPATPGGRVNLRRLPAREMTACVLHNGLQSTTQEAYAALFEWVARKGCLVEGHVRELYLGETDEREQAERVVELQVPVCRKTAAGTRQAGSSKGEIEMEPEIVTKPAFMVVGLQYLGKNQNQEISQMWGRFNQQAGEIKHVLLEAAYGLCFTMEGARDGEFEYVAGLSVSQIDQLPEGMVARIVPLQKYAVFTVHSLNELAQKYPYIYQTWLPQSGFKLVEPGFDMEVYGNEFDPATAKGDFYIFVAIQ